MKLAAARQRAASVRAKRAAFKPYIVEANEHVLVGKLIPYTITQPLIPIRDELLREFSGSTIEAGSCRIHLPPH